MGAAESMECGEDSPEHSYMNFYGSWRIRPDWPCVSSVQGLKHAVAATMRRCPDTTISASQLAYFVMNCFCDGLSLIAFVTQDEEQHADFGTTRKSSFSLYKDVTLAWSDVGPKVEHCCAVDPRTRDETGAVQSDWGSVASDINTVPFARHGKANTENWSNTEAALSYRRAAQASQEADIDVQDQSEEKYGTKSIRSRSGSTGRSTASSRVEDLMKGSKRLNKQRRGQIRKDLMESLNDGSLEPQASA